MKETSPVRYSQVCVIKPLNLFSVKRKYRGATRKLNIPLE